MKIATIRTRTGPVVGRIDGDEFTVVAEGAVEDLLAASPADWQERVRTADGRLVPMDMSRLAPVVTRPSKVICLGHNYLAHIEEMGREPPEHPTLFAKFARSLIGAHDPIVLPRTSAAMDWEAELAVVIGREIRHADETAARDAIAGYTVLNDVTARDYQHRTLQWLQGKTFEATSPLGPWLVTPDEVDHATDLKIQCLVNGDVMQESSTADLLFRPEHAVSYISRIITLDPGDIIALGTPSGVGAGRNPQMFLAKGDVVETAVQGVGTLRNACQQEA